VNGGRNCGSKHASKRNVSFANTKQVVHVAMVVVNLDYDVLNFLLHTDAETVVNGVLKLRSMSVGNSCAGMAACDNAPNGPQKKKPGALPTAAAAWADTDPESRPDKRLNVAQIDHCVRRNLCMAGRHYPIEPVDSDKETG
jgi:hypothetical protein